MYSTQPESDLSLFSEDVKTLSLLKPNYFQLCGTISYRAMVSGTLSMLWKVERPFIHNYEAARDFLIQEQTKIMVNLKFNKAIPYAYGQPIRVWAAHPRNRIARKIRTKNFRTIAWTSISAVSFSK